MSIVREMSQGLQEFRLLLGQLPWDFQGLSFGHGRNRFDQTVDNSKLRQQVALDKGPCSCALVLALNELTMQASPVG